MLAVRIEGAAFDLHAELVRAARDPARGREALVAADVALDKLRAYLRLAKDLKLLSLDGYEHAARRVTEIGRLLGGWRGKMRGNARETKDIDPASGGDDER